MILLVGGEKGGTGKTTLAINLAVKRILEGHDVLLFDTDIQGSASYWTQIRDEAEIKPRVPCLQKFGKKLKEEIIDLSNRYEDIIIDAGGRDSIELRAALVVTDKLFTPILPAQFDVWTLDQMENLVETAMITNSNLQAYVVINRGSTNPSVKETSETLETLTEFKELKLANAVIRDRIAFRKAARAGLSVMELKPSDRRAIDELMSFYQEVFNL